MANKQRYKINVHHRMCSHNSCLQAASWVKVETERPLLFSYGLCDKHKQADVRKPFRYVFIGGEEYKRLLAISALVDD